MAVIERQTSVVGLRYACDNPGCLGEMLREGPPAMTQPIKWQHVCTACGARQWLDREYPTYEIRVQPLGAT